MAIQHAAKVKFKRHVTCNKTDARMNARGFRCTRNPWWSG